MMKRSMALLMLLVAVAAPASEDPHYNEAGFFDIHVCNWPEKPRFIMAIFATERFDEVERISIYSQAGRAIGDLNLDKFRAFQSKQGKPKRAFIEHFDIGEGDADGWYRAEVTLRNGSRYEAQDYVVITQMRHPEQLDPPRGAEDIPLPSRLSWSAVPGAKFYQVFIRDKWEDRLVFSSELTNKNELPLPKDVLQPGGYYGWRIHARDGDGNVLLGDFNHGSLNAEATFSVSE